VYGKLTFTPHGHIAPLVAARDRECTSTEGPPFDAQRLVGQWISEKSRVSRFATADHDDLLPASVPHARRGRR
jgi:hypothetical protein